MKRKIYNSIFMILFFAFTLILTSCEDDNNQEKIVRENLEYREIGTDSFDDKSSQNEITHYHFYNSNNHPIVKYVNESDELNVELFFGLGEKSLREIRKDKETNSAVLDQNQELTLKAYRKVEWFTNGYVANNKIKEPIVTKIFEYNNSLGFFMSDEFDKTLKTIKCGDVVTLNELYKNYYTSEEKETYDMDFTKREVETYCWVSYYCELTCEENDYIKYLKKNEDGSIGEIDKIINPFCCGLDYEQVKKISLGGIIIQLEIIDNEIFTYWYEEGVKHYY